MSNCSHTCRKSIPSFDFGHSFSISFLKLTCLKVFIHNPHQKYSFQGTGRTDNQPLIDSNLSLLNINAVVTSISTGCLDVSNKNELLFVGTKTSILAYDVNNNADLFYKEVRYFLFR